MCRAADSSIRRRTREQLDLPLATSVKATPPPSRRHRRRMGSLVGGHHGEYGERAYNGGLGAEPSAGSRGRAPGQGVS